MRYTRLTSKEIENISNEYMKGASLNSLVKKYKRGKCTISKIINGNFQNKERKNAKEYYRYPKELEDANIEIKKYLSVIRESKTYNTFLNTL